MWLWLRFSNQDDLRLNPMGSQFSTTILWNLYSESVRTIKFWDLVEDSHTGGPSLIAIRMENLICFSILILWTLCGIFGGPLTPVGEGWWGGSESLSSDQLKFASFSTRDFNRSSKHDTLWHVLSTGYFYLYEPLLIQILVPWKFIKTLPSLVYYHFYSQQPRR